MPYIKSLLSKNEHIVIHTRKHPICLFVPFILDVGAIVVIAGVAVYVAHEETRLFLPILLLSVFPFSLFSLSYLKWQNQEYFVTNRRIVQSEGIISKRVIDSSLEKVNDVILAQSWLGRCLDYGDVEILTASEMGVNDLTTIRRPVHFKTEMLNLKEALGLDEHYRTSEGNSKGSIAELISSLEKLRKEEVLTQEEFQEKKVQLLARM